jgi:cleavage and polyadenylation specificity factor subunit 2
LRREREELESSSESEEEEEDTTIRTRHDLMLVSESKQRAGFFKQAKKSYPMFPIREEKLKWDDYGEIIR